MNIVILAAGSGKRMQSQLPKVLHKLADQPLISHVINTALSLRPKKLIVVVGHQASAIKKMVNTAYKEHIIWVEQTEQLGTGHAVAQAAKYLDPHSHTLILYGDVPLISQLTLSRLIDQTANQFGILTIRLNDPSGYGRILRNSTDSVLGIVEEKDANDKQRAISEINTGIILAPTIALLCWLNTIDNNNAQREYYLTDTVAKAIADNFQIITVTPANELEITGVNSRQQLVNLERAYQLLKANELLAAGVGLADLNRIDIRGQLNCGTDVFIDINVIFQGEVTIGNNVTIGPHCIIQDAVIGDNTHIQAYSHIVSTKIGADAIVGPYARLRPGTDLANNVHVGNFVEIKNAQISSRTKVNHLSYIGDAKLGSNVNIGAGTITCNYDGINKHQTVVGNNVFIGSDSQLIAPISIADNTTIAAGTTVWRDVPEQKENLVLNNKTQNYKMCSRKSNKT